jgi:hypothetical protein
MGYSTDIYAENIDKRLPEGTAIKADKLRDLKKDDALIYHKSTGTDLSFKIDNYKCRRVMIYHNITPPDFFRPYSASATQLTEYGYKGVEYLRDKMDYVLAVSEYNKSELIRMGYTRDLPSMKGIGYKEIFGFLNGEYDLFDARELIQKNTRHYAKRQYTWLKRYDFVTWIDIHKGETVGDVVDRILSASEGQAEDKE